MRRPTLFTTVSQTDRPSLGCDVSWRLEAVGESPKIEGRR